MARATKRARAEVEQVTEVLSNENVNDENAEVENVKDIDVLQEHGIVSIVFLLLYI